jgi:hypothetical protein
VKTPTPNLDVLKAGIARMLAEGVPAAVVEDIYIAASARNADVYTRALYEYSLLPRIATEGRSSFRSGVLSPGARRSVSGFRQFVIGGASP